MIAEDKLMAYVDGELPAGERGSVRAALAEDEHLLQEALAREELLRLKVAEPYHTASKRGGGAGQADTVALSPARVNYFPQKVRCGRIDRS